MPVLVRYVAVTGMLAPDKLGTFGVPERMPLASSVIPEGNPVADQLIVLPSYSGSPEIVSKPFRSYQ
ncbi:hypothetical protein D3C73_1607970 [compost metagenome]